MSLFNSETSVSIAARFVMGIMAGLLLSGGCFLISSRFTLDVTAALVVGLLILKLAGGTVLCFVEGWSPVAAGLIVSIPLEMLIFVSECFRALSHG